MFDAGFWGGIGGLSLLCGLFAVFALIYTLFFWALFAWGKMDGPRAIRWAWTIGAAWLLLGTFLWSPYHAGQMAWRRSDPAGLLNTGLVFLIALLMVLTAWIFVPPPRRD